MKFNNSTEEILNKLLEKGADLNFESEFGITPLMMSCYFNNRELILYLIEHKADLNITNMDNDSPLVIATYFNNKNIINILVKNNAKNFKNKYNETAISIANTMSNDELLKILETYYIGIIYYFISFFFIINI